MVYSCAGRAASKNVADNVRHMVVEMERIFDGNSADGRMVWIVDFAGFGWRDCNPKLGLEAMPLFASHYPERLSQWVMVDPPAVFSVMWAAIFPTLDPVTQRKIAVLKGPASIDAHFAEHWAAERGADPALAPWLRAVFASKRAAPGAWPAGLATLSAALDDETTVAWLARSENGAAR